MKKIITVMTIVIGLVALTTLSFSGNDKINKGDCSYKGITLHGKVMVVSSFPDIKVKVVSSFPDVKVQTVNSFPDKCGKWQFVTSFPDFKIQYVESFQDIKIKFVNSFPGVE
jgi:hypothetical protein